jgi:tetratricopeptide (TPR) repeat protein
MCQPLERLLEPPYDEARIARTWQHIAEARDRQPHAPSRAWIAAIPAAALAAAAAVLAVVDRPAAIERPRPLAALDPATSVAAGAEVAAPRGLPSTLALDDGSRVALAPGARVQVLANDGARFSALLVQGTATFEVSAEPSRRWEVETSLATLEVVGTRVVIAHAAHHVTIRVDRGVVMVRGERVTGRVQRLVAGQELVVAREATALERDADAPAARSSAPQRAADPVPAAAGLASEPRATAPPDPVAPAAPLGAGAPPPSAPPEPLSGAILEADRLRDAEPAAAAALLERALDTQRDGAAAGLAAFALGRLYLESLADPVRAAEVFRRIVDRGTPRGLLEDAHSRLVEALIASGEHHRAREALSEYLRRYPEGRRAAGLRARLERAAAERAAPAAP